MQNSGSEQLFSKARHEKVRGAEGERHQVSPMSNKERAPLHSYTGFSRDRIYPMTPSCRYRPWGRVGNKVDPPASRTS